MSDPTFSYPRAGRDGDPRLARATAELLEEAASAGIPLRRLGPSLVQGFFGFLRWLPKRAKGSLELGHVPGLYLLLGSGTNPLKMSRHDAAYQDKPVSSQKCANCSSAYRQLVTGDVSCSQIQGLVTERSWCRLWSPERN